MSSTNRTMPPTVPGASYQGCTSQRSQIAEPSGSAHALLLDPGRLAGQAALVGGAPLRLHVRVDVVVAAAEDGRRRRRVVAPASAVDREIAHLAVQHRHRARRVVDEELQPLLAVAKAVRRCPGPAPSVSCTAPPWIRRGGRRTAADGPSPKGSSIRPNRPTPVDKARSVRYRLAQCPCPPRAAITRSTTWAMQATTGPAEVRANSKGHDTPEHSSRRAPRRPSRRGVFFCPPDDRPDRRRRGLRRP